MLPGKLLVIFRTLKSKNLLSYKLQQKTWDILCESFPKMISFNQSKPLNEFVDECVKIGWYFAVQKPTVELECSNRTFSGDFHVHYFGHKNVGLKQIQNYLWPALYDSSEDYCLHKAIVVTA